jgi:hypothetical protein
MSEAIRHNNVVIFDDRGIPSIMVRFENPRAAVTPPMFIIGGKEVDSIYISKYPNKVIKGRAYSLPMVDPTTEITFDEALAACRTKGEGWHLMTATEWEYLLNESRNKGTLPHGNTDWGKDFYHKEEQGEREGCGCGRTLTGSGPATWNHDHTIYGVSDLKGLVWEWLAGLRIVNGVLGYIPNNDAALAGCDLSRDSGKWQQIITDKFSKSAVRVNVEGGEITITDKVAGEGYTPEYDSVSWEGLKVDLQEIPQALRYLGILPENGVLEEKNTYVYFDATEGEYLPIRGASFLSAHGSGSSAIGLTYPRFGSDGIVGFRSAFYEVNVKPVSVVDGGFYENAKYQDYLGVRF